MALKKVRIVKNKVVAGIDPGLSGAIAFLSDSGELMIYDIPTITVPSGRKSKKTGKIGKKREYDFARIKYFLLSHEPSVVVIERLQIGGKPGAFKQSAQAVSTTSKNYGFLIGLLFGMAIPYEEVTAAVWQRYFFKGKVGNTKDQSYHLACTKFPSHSEYFIGKKGAKKDGRTDASLIALYARRKHA